jgi:hypothetical protein
VSEQSDDEITPAELEEFDYLLQALKAAGYTTVTGFDVLTEFGSAAADYHRFQRAQRDRERRSTWRPSQMLRAALAPGEVTKELGDLTLNELREIEVPLEKLVELRRSLRERGGSKDQSTS